MELRLRQLLILWSSLCTAGLGAQSSAQTPHTEGDVSLRHSVDAETRKIYDSAKPEIFLIKKSGAPGLPKNQNWEITGSYWNGELARIVAVSWNAKGKLGVEYYLQSGTVLMIYETFGYFTAEAPAGAWRNFRNLPGWERRTYFRSGKAGFIETNGVGMPAKSDRAYLSEMAALSTLIERERRAHPPVKNE